MTEPDRPPPLKRLDERLRAARQSQDRRADDGGAAGGGLGLGMRIAVEIVAAIAVGVGIGVLLDKWLGTQPLMLIVFLVLGAAAALRNVIRLAHRMEERQSARHGNDGGS